MSTITVPLPPIELPDDIAEQARREGLLTSQAIGKLVQDALIWRSREESDEAFSARATASWQNYLRTGISHTTEDVFAELRAMGEARRKQLPSRSQP